MSYARWWRGSGWYIYRQSGRALRPEDEVLSVWHASADPGESGTEFRYPEVSAMLVRNDFSSIRGWSPSANLLLKEALHVFVKDVERDHGGSSSSPERNRQ